MAPWDTYVAPRLTMIHNPAIGRLQVTLYIIIFAYAVVFNIILSKGYMKTEDPLGTMRFRLMAPNLDYLPTSQAAPEYCGSPGDTFPDAKNPDRVFPKQACRAQWDGYSEPYPESEETSLSITTRVSKLTQTVTPGCTTESTRAECFWTPPEDDAVPEVFYIPQVEYFTLMLSHTMYAAKIDVYKSAKDMRGQIVDRDGNVLDPCDDYTSWGVECPPYIGDKGNDIFALATLLRAAGVDLDQESETTLEGGKNGNEDEHVPNRFEGIVLLVNIYYDNTISFNANDFLYTITCRMVPMSEYKVEQVIYPDGALQERVILNRHGMKLMVKQSGTVGKFSFGWLIVQLTAALGLLAVAQVVVKQVAMRLAKDKDAYKAALFKEVVIEGDSLGIDVPDMFDEDEDGAGGEAELVRKKEADENSGLVGNEQ